MNSFNRSTPCPCESGLDFHDCCGNPDSQSIKIIANIAADGACSAELTDELNTALDDFAQTPGLFPVSINLQENYCEVVKMSPFWFSESIFLDANRIYGTSALRCDLQWLTQRMDQIKWQPTPFIFHTAFCGSTLMSKALDLIYDTLPLREPDLLATLLNVSRSGNTTQAHEKQWYERILKLLSRRFENSQQAVVKANDFVNPILAPLLQHNEKMQALFMYTPLSEFLSGCLKAENRMQWIAERYQFISPNLSSIFPTADFQQIGTLDHEKMAAVYWSYNIKILIAAYDQYSEQIKTLDFNSFLDNPLGAVAVCADWFNLKKLKDVNPIIEMNWLMSVYSKNPDCAYSTEIRRKEINEILTKHSEKLLKAEQIAADLLGSAYPFDYLPGRLL